MGVLHRLAVVGLLAGALQAQVLTRPGWKGTGVHVEPWWQRGVFYRIAPERFQDSDGDGIGDLAGIAQRLDYIQSLGVDAVVITLPGGPDSPAAKGFDDLARTAAQHRIRVIAEIAPLPNATTDLTVGEARWFLNQGAAGILLETSAFESALGDATMTDLLHALRRLTDGSAGGRILLAQDVAPLHDVLQQTAQLVVDSVPESEKNTNSSAHRVKAVTAARMVSFKKTVHASSDATRRDAEVSAAMARVFAGAGAVLFDAGDELGLDAPATLMQWTPTNITPPKKDEPPAAQIERREPLKQQAPAPVYRPDTQIPAGAREDVYGPYRPYVPPPPKPKKVDPSMADAAPPKTDPATLPGYTTGVLPQQPSADAATRNAASEDGDEHSRLNFVRALSRLHRANSAVRSGDRTELNTQVDGVDAWLLRATSGNRRTTLLVIANTTTQEQRIDFTADFARLVPAIRASTAILRVLLSSGTANVFPQRGNQFAVPSLTVLVCELYR